VVHEAEEVVVNSRRELPVLFALTAATAVIAGAMLWAGQTTSLEAISFVTGAVCVWLTVKESAWNFPVSMANVAAFLFVFARAGLYADAGLQVVYFFLSAVGWYLWLYGGADRKELRVSRVPAGEAALVAITGIGITAGLAAYLRHAGGSVPFWDALTTAISLAAQWLLNRKYLENWLCWIVADVIYVPLYAYKSLYLTSVLYVVFLCMATMGWFVWRATRNSVAPVSRGLAVVAE
jgi:nicotinamide mononucleotide transporter